MIKKEILVFIFVGVLTVLIDLISYQYLYSYLTFNINAAKGLGFCAGTSFAYLANRFWTFGDKANVFDSIYRFIPLYFFTLVTNISVNLVVLETLNYFLYIEHVAFIVATACSAVLNFLGMKFYVFRSSKV